MQPAASPRQRIFFRHRRSPFARPNSGLLASAWLQAGSLLPLTEFSPTRILFKIHFRFAVAGVNISSSEVFLEKVFGGFYCFFFIPMFNFADIRNVRVETIIKFLKNKLFE